MDKGKKRDRNVNFTREETEKLVCLADKYKSIIENKKSDAVTWQEKEKAWKTIESEFNCSATGTFRDAKHLKLKFEAIKRDTRKKSSALRRELYKTGGGVNDAPPLTPIEQKVKQMILLSVEGGESTCDSDLLDVGATDTQGEIIVLPEPTDLSENLVIPLTDSDTADHSKEINVISENPPKKINLDYVDNPMPSTSSQVDIEVIEPPPKKWADWKPSKLKSKKHPVLCKPKEKRPFDKLAEGKLEIVQLQKTIIEEELQEKKLKKQMLEMEIQYKKELYELEKEERLLKISILKCELENKKKFDK